MLKRNMILLKKLMTLKEVIDFGQIQMAASKNGLRQSNFSHLISQLENDLKCNLLMRSSTGVTPTNTAQLLYVEIQKISDILENINTSFIKSEDLSGTLNLWTEIGIVGNYIIKNLSDFYAMYPKIRLNILTEKNIDLKNVDIAILDTQRYAIPKTATRLFSFKAQSHFYTTQKYLNTHGTPKDLDDLTENFDLCVRTHDLQLPEMVHILKKAKHLNTTSDSGAVIFRLIADNEGISLFPDWMVNLSPNLIPIKSLDFSVDKHFIAFSPKKGIDPRVSLYIEHTKKANRYNLKFE